MKAASISSLAFSCALIACGGSSAPAGSDEPEKENENPEVMAEALVGTSGGVVASQAMEVSLSVPAGALEFDVNITVEVEEEAAPKGVSLLSPVFRFEPGGLTFAEPAIVELHFDGPADGAVAFWSREDGIGYETLEGTIEGQSILAEVHHFSEGFVGKRAEDGCGMYDAVLASTGSSDPEVPLCHPGLCASGTSFAYCDGPVAVCCGTPDPGGEPNGVGGADSGGGTGGAGGGATGSAGAAGSGEGGASGETTGPDPDGSGGSDSGSAGSTGAAGSAGATGSAGTDSGSGAGGTGSGGSGSREEPPPADGGSGGEGGAGGASGADGAAGSAGAPGADTGSGTR